MLEHNEVRSNSGTVAHLLSITPSKPDSGIMQARSGMSGPRLTAGKQVFRAPGLPEPWSFDSEMHGEETRATGGRDIRPQQMIVPSFQDGDSVELRFNGSPLYAEAVLRQLGHLGCVAWIQSYQIHCLSNRKTRRQLNEYWLLCIDSHHCRRAVRVTLRGTGDASGS